MEIIEKKEDFLIKISKKTNIMKLYKKYSNTKELKMIHQSISKEEGNLIWQKIHEMELNSLIDFYEEIIFETVNHIIQLLSPYSNIINVKSVIATIKRFLLENMAMLSNNMFRVEIENNQNFLFLFVNDYEIFLKTINKYPYWFQMVNNILKENEIFIKEFLIQLIQDAEYVTENFFGSQSIIEDIILSKGDKHRGRFVIEIRTHKGDFFYKPRKADVDEAFQRWLDILSENDEILKMEIPKFIKRSTYSWFKKVIYTPLCGMEDKKRYYQRLGQLVATIYILNGNDIHHENLISCGEQPVIVDLETLLTSRLLFTKKSLPEQMKQKENVCLIDSVRNSMILPNVFKYKENHLEISPFNFTKKVENLNIDKMKNHKIEESEISFIMDEVCKGFRAVYHEVEYKKDKYKKYFDENFSQLHVRYLNKATSEYADLTKLLVNPVCLYDSSYAFALTARLYTSKDENVSLEELFEQKEILKLDIPYFEIKVDSRDLILSEKVIIKDYFAESPLDGLNAKLDILGSRDFKRQITIMEKMFEVIRPDFKVKEIMDVQNEFPNLPIIVSIKSIENFKEKAIKQIFEQSLVHPISGNYFWIDPILEGNHETGEKYYKVNDIPNSYYAGSVGILIALLALDDSKKYWNYIDKLIADIEKDINHIFQYNHNEMNIGAYNGLASYLRYYMVLNRNRLIQESVFEERVGGLLNQIETSIVLDHKFDVLDGTAGVALVLVELYQVVKTNYLQKKVISNIKKCRKHILENIVYKDKNTYISIENRKNFYYGGFAHGLCGISMAFYKISKILQTDDKEMVDQILMTERKLYDSSKRVWYRDNEKKDCSWGWCHGSPGILLARLEMYKDGYSDSFLLEEIQLLYEATLKNAFGSNLTFCHGDLSNVIICQYAQELLGFCDDRVKDYIEKIIPYILHSMEYKVRGSEAVGLMSGLMGITLFLDNIMIKKEQTDLRRIIEAI